MDSEIMVYIPKLKIFLFAAEGCGDNLSAKDIDNNYVDYYSDRNLWIQL